MSEKKLYLDGLELIYEGLFNLNELLKAINAIVKDRGYVKGEKRREEVIKSTGREFSMELRPVKRKTDNKIAIILMVRKFYL